MYPKNILYNNLKLHSVKFYQENYFFVYVPINKKAFKI